MSTRIELDPLARLAWRRHTTREGEREKRSYTHGPGGVRATIECCMGFAPSEGRSVNCLTFVYKTKQKQ